MIDLYAFRAFRIDHTAVNFSGDEYSQNIAIACKADIHHIKELIFEDMRTRMKYLQHHCLDLR